MDTKDIFASKLLEIREQKGISRKKMADDLGISRASLEYYEKGKRTPDLNIISQISNYLEVSIDYLMGKTKCISPNEDLQSVCKFFNTDVTMVLGIKKLINANRKYKDELKKIISSSYFQMFLYHIFYTWTLRTKMGYAYLDELEEVSQYIDMDNKRLYELFDTDGYYLRYEKEIDSLNNEIELNEYRAQKLFLNNLLNCNSEEYNRYGWDSYEQYLDSVIPTETFFCSVGYDIEMAKDEINEKINEYVDEHETEIFTDYEQSKDGDNNANNPQT